MKERGVGKDKDHINLHLDHLDKGVLEERLPGITEAGFMQRHLQMLI